MGTPVKLAQALARYWLRTVTRKSAMASLALNGVEPSAHIGVQVPGDIRGFRMTGCEGGMAVFYDSVTRAVFINFRGALSYLTKPFTTKAAAILASEAKCRELGWRASSPCGAE